MARKTRGLQLNTSVQSMSDVQRALGQIQEYLNSGVDIIDKEGLEKHGLVWLPKKHPQGTLRICRAKVQIKFLSSATLLGTQTIWQYPATIFPVNAAVTSVLSSEAPDGDPRFIHEPFCYFSPAGFGGSPPTTFPWMVAAPYGALAWKRRRYMTVSHYHVWWNTNDTVTLYLLAIGWGEGES